jgi:hypothetical protein
MKPDDEIPACPSCGGFVVSDDDACLYCSACGLYTGVCADDDLEMPAARDRDTAGERRGDET